MNQNLIKSTLYSFLLLTLIFSSCKKEESGDKQITEFIQKNNINAVKDPSGMYYQIIKPGTGTFKYSSNTKITIKYEGRLLNGNVFDDGNGQEQTFPLSGLIQGWQIGIPLIQNGGEIRLMIPPDLGYGNQAAGAIPKNSVLDFTIQLINAQ